MFKLLNWSCSENRVLYKIDVRVDTEVPDKRDKGAESGTDVYSVADSFSSALEKTKDAQMQELLKNRNNVVGESEKLLTVMWEYSDKGKEKAKNIAQRLSSLQSFFSIPLSPRISNSIIQENSYNLLDDFANTMVSMQSGEANFDESSGHIEFVLKYYENIQAKITYYSEVSKELTKRLSSEISVDHDDLLRKYLELTESQDESKWAEVPRFFALEDAFENLNTNLDGASNILLQKSFYVSLALTQIFEHSARNDVSAIMENIVRFNAYLDILRDARRFSQIPLKDKDLKNADTETRLAYWVQEKKVSPDQLLEKWCDCSNALLISKMTPDEMYSSLINSLLASLIDSEASKNYQSFNNGLANANALKKSELIDEMKKEQENLVKYSKYLDEAKEKALKNPDTTVDKNDPIRFMNEDICKWERSIALVSKKMMTNVRKLMVGQFQFEMTIAFVGGKVPIKDFNMEYANKVKDAVYNLNNSTEIRDFSEKYGFPVSPYFLDLKKIEDLEKIGKMDFEFKNALSKGGEFAGLNLSGPEMRSQFSDYSLGKEVSSDVVMARLTSEMAILHDLREEMLDEINKEELYFSDLYANKRFYSLPEDEKPYVQARLNTFKNYLIEFRNVNSRYTSSMISADNAMKKSENMRLFINMDSYSLTKVPISENYSEPNYLPLDEFVETEFLVMDDAKYLLENIDIYLNDQNLNVFSFDNYNEEKMNFVSRQSQIQKDLVLYSSKIDSALAGKTNLSDFTQEEKERISSYLFLLAEILYRNSNYKSEIKKSIYLAQKNANTMDFSPELAKLDNNEKIIYEKIQLVEAYFGAENTPVQIKKREKSAIKPSENHLRIIEKELNLKGSTDSVVKGIFKGFENRFVGLNSFANKINAYYSLLNKGQSALVSNMLSGGGPSELFQEGVDAHNDLIKFVEDSRSNLLIEKQRLIELKKNFPADDPIYVLMPELKEIREKLLNDKIEQINFILTDLNSPLGNEMISKLSDSRDNIFLQKTNYDTESLNQFYSNVVIMAAAVGITMLTAGGASLALGATSLGTTAAGSAISMGVVTGVSAFGSTIGSIGGMYASDYFGFSKYDENGVIDNAWGNFGNDFLRNLAFQSLSLGTGIGLGKMASFTRFAVSGSKVLRGFNSAINITGKSGLKALRTINPYSSPGRGFNPSSAMSYIRKNPKALKSFKGVMGTGLQFLKASTVNYALEYTEESIEEISGTYMTKLGEKMGFSAENAQFMGTITELVLASASASEGKNLDLNVEGINTKKSGIVVDSAGNLRYMGFASDFQNTLSSQYNLSTGSGEVSYSFDPATGIIQMQIANSVDNAVSFTFLPMNPEVRSGSAEIQNDDLQSRRRDRNLRRDDGMKVEISPDFLAEEKGLEGEENNAGAGIVDISPRSVERRKVALEEDSRSTTLREGGMLDGVKKLDGLTPQSSKELSREFNEENRDYFEKRIALARFYGEIMDKSKNGSKDKLSSLITEAVDKKDYADQAYNFVISQIRLKSPENPLILSENQILLIKKRFEEHYVRTKSAKVILNSTGEKRNNIVEIILKKSENRNFKLQNNVVAIIQGEKFDSSLIIVLEDEDFKNLTGSDTVSGQALDFGRKNITVLKRSQFESADFKNAIKHEEQHSQNKYFEERDLSVKENDLSYQKLSEGDYIGSINAQINSQLLFSKDEILAFYYQHGTNIDFIFQRFSLGSYEKYLKIYYSALNDALDVSNLTNVEIDIIRENFHLKIKEYREQLKMALEVMASIINSGYPNAYDLLAFTPIEKWNDLFNYLKIKYPEIEIKTETLSNDPYSGIVLQESLPKTYDVSEVDSNEFNRNRITKGEGIEIDIDSSEKVLILRDQNDSFAYTIRKIGEEYYLFSSSSKNGYKLKKGIRYSVNQSIRENKPVEVTESFCPLFNEQIFDFIFENGKITIRQSNQNETVVLNDVLDRVHLNESLINQRGESILKISPLGNEIVLEDGSIVLVKKDPDTDIISLNIPGKNTSESVLPGRFSSIVFPRLLNLGNGEVSFSSNREDLFVREFSPDVNGLKSDSEGKVSDLMAVSPSQGRPKRITVPDLPIVLPQKQNNVRRNVIDEGASVNETSSQMDVGVKPLATAIANSNGRISETKQIQMPAILPEVEKIVQEIEMEQEAQIELSKEDLEMFDKRIEMAAIMAKFKKMPEEVFLGLYEPGMKKEDFAEKVLRALNVDENGNPVAKLTLNQEKLFKSKVLDYFVALKSAQAIFRAPLSSTTKEQLQLADFLSKLQNLSKEDLLTKRKRFKNESRFADAIIKELNPGKLTKKQREVLRKKVLAYAKNLQESNDIFADLSHPELIDLLSNLRRMKYDEFAEFKSPKEKEFAQKVLDFLKVDNNGKKSFDLSEEQSVFMQSKIIAHFKNSQKEKSILSIPKDQETIIRKMIRNLYNVELTKPPRVVRGELVKSVIVIILSDADYSKLYPGSEGVSLDVYRGNIIICNESTYSRDISFHEEIHAINKLSSHRKVALKAVEASRVAFEAGDLENGVKLIFEEYTNLMQDEMLAYHGDYGTNIEQIFDVLFGESNIYDSGLKNKLLWITKNFGEIHLKFVQTEYVKYRNVVARGLEIFAILIDSKVPNAHELLSLIPIDQWPALLEYVKKKYPDIQLTSRKLDRDPLFDLLTGEVVQSKEEPKSIALSMDDNLTLETGKSYSIDLADFNGAMFLGEDSGRITLQKFGENIQLELPGKGFVGFLKNMELYIGKKLDGSLEATIEPDDLNTMSYIKIVFENNVLVLSQLRDGETVKFNKDLSYYDLNVNGDFFRGQLNFARINSNGSEVLMDNGEKLYLFYDNDSYLLHVFDVEGNTLQSMTWGSQNSFPTHNNLSVSCLGDGYVTFRGMRRDRSAKFQNASIDLTEFVNKARAQFKSADG